ncbi:MAG: pilus assembly protein [Deltaproteobacteria bacterium]|nr:pilus assembly protein [Deltaproteobacteria bacterium]
MLTVAPHRQRKLREREAPGGTSFCERGATVMEMVFITILSWIVIAACMDFARFLTVQILLTQAAQEGLSLARTIEGLDRCAPGNPVDCSGATSAMGSVETAMRRIPTSTIVATEGTPGAPQRLAAAPQVLLPGLGNAAPNYPDPVCGQLMDGTDATMSNLLYHCPVVLRIEAEVRFMLPFLGTRNVLVQVSGFRESGKSDDEAFPESEYFPI